MTQQTAEMKQDALGLVFLISRYQMAKHAPIEIIGFITMRQAAEIPSFIHIQVKL
jgi:hypothetical protein